MTQKSENCKTAKWDGKPFRYFSDYLRHTYRCRVLKIPINANLSCPNRDGTLNTAGCIFCSEDGSASPGITGSASIPEQILLAKKKFKRSEPTTKYIAYFQAFTNTYAPAPVLKKMYDLAVRQDDIIGLMIGTRPDCLDDETMDLIAEYNKKGFELWLEIGMQSVHEKSLDFLRRAHTNVSTVDAVRRAASRGIPVCVHLILGITGETWNDMMSTAESLQHLPVRGVKFHHLHVIRGTELENLFLAGRINPLSQKEYVSILCDFIERISPRVLIHRLAADREETTLVAPKWGLRKGTVIKAITDEFARRGTYQGFLFEKGLKD